MKALVFGCALAMSAAAMLAGCGGSQPPIGATGATPQSRFAAMPGPRGRIALAGVDA